MSGAPASSSVPAPAGGTRQGPAFVYPPRPTFAGPIPEFSGPWAAELAQTYRSTTSTVVHQILADGRVSDQEHASVSSAYTACMKNKGFTATVDGVGSGGSIEGNGASDAETMKAQSVCSPDIDDIGDIQYDMLRNPQHLDEHTIIVACLIKNKVVPSSYTPKQYGIDIEHDPQTFPFDADDPVFNSCIGDPLAVGSR